MFTPGWADGAKALCMLTLWHVNIKYRCCIAPILKQSIYRTIVMRPMYIEVNRIDTSICSVDTYWKCWRTSDKTIVVEGSLLPLPYFSSRLYCLPPPLSPSGGCTKCTAYQRNPTRYCLQNTHSWGGYLLAFGLDIPRTRYPVLALPGSCPKLTANWHESGLGAAPSLDPKSLDVLCHHGCELGPLAEDTALAWEIFQF